MQSGEEMGCFCERRCYCQKPPKDKTIEGIPIHQGFSTRGTSDGLREYLAVAITATGTSTTAMLLAHLLIDHGDLLPHTRVATEALLPSQPAAVGTMTQKG